MPGAGGEVHPGVGHVGAWCDVGVVHGATLVTAETDWLGSCVVAVWVSRGYGVVI